MVSSTLFLVILNIQDGSKHTTYIVNSVATLIFFVYFKAEILRDKAINDNLIYIPNNNNAISLENI